MLTLFVTFLTISSANDASNYAQNKTNRSTRHRRSTKPPFQNGSPFCDLSHPSHASRVARYTIDFDQYPEYEVKLEVNDGHVFLKAHDKPEPIQERVVIFMLKLPDLQRFIVSEFKFSNYASIKVGYTICDFETTQFLSMVKYPVGKLRYTYFEYRLTEIVQSNTEIDHLHHNHDRYGLRIDFLRTESVGNLSIRFLQREMFLKKIKSEQTERETRRSQLTSGVIIVVNLVFISVPAVSFCHLQYSKKEVKREMEKEKASQEEFKKARDKVINMCSTVMKWQGGRQTRLSSSSVARSTPIAEKKPVNSENCTKVKPRAGLVIENRPEGTFVKGYL